MAITTQKQIEQQMFGELNSSLFGINFFVTEHAIQGKWVFPYDKYIEYGPEDEWWAIKMNFGYFENVPACFQIGNKMYMHPTIYEEFKKTAYNSNEFRVDKSNVKIPRKLL